MKTRSLIPFSVLLLLTAASAVRSQWIETNWPNTSTVKCFTRNSSTIVLGTLADDAYLSTDDGINWAKTVVDTALGNNYIYSLTSLGTNIFAGGSGKIFRSTDGGKNWVKTSTGIGSGTVDALASSGTLLFSGTSLTSDRDIFLSRDSGAHWVSAGAYFFYNYLYCLLAKDSLLFAGTDGGPYVTTDSGKNWAVIRTGIPALAFYIYSMAATKDYVFAGTNFYQDHSLFRTSDNGEHWTSADSGLPKTDVHALTVRGNDIYAGLNNGSVFVSSDNGITWTDISNGLQKSSITAFCLTTQDLLAGTFSEGVWYRPQSGFGISREAEAGSRDIVMHPNYPNPFSSATTLSFSLAKTDYVTIMISDILGKNLANLFSGTLEAGEHSFEWNARGLAPGVYQCSVRTAGGDENHSLLLLSK